MVVGRGPVVDGGRGATVVVASAEQQVPPPIVPEIAAPLDGWVVQIGAAPWLHVPVGKLREDRYLPLHPQLVDLIDSLATPTAASHGAHKETQK